MTGSTDLAVREEAGAPALRLPVLPDLPDTDTWIRAMASIAKLAATIAHTSFVPKGLRGDEAAVTAAILTGRELGLPPMAALRHIHVVEGVPSLDAEYKRAKVQSLGHEFDVVEWDHEHCIVSGRRRGSAKPPLIVSYTINDAKRAELVKSGSNYIKRPKVMMLARATTLMCSALFSDVTNGLATTELLEAGDEDAIADAIGTSLPAPEPKQRVTAGQARARAPQHVTATVVTSSPSPAGTESPAPDASAPPPAEEPPAGEAPGPGPGPDDPAWQRALKAAQAQCKKITADPAARLDYARRILRVNEVLSFSDLTIDELRTVASVVNSVASADELEAFLSSGEVSGAQ